MTHPPKLHVGVKKILHLETWEGHEANIVSPNKEYAASLQVLSELSHEEHHLPALPH